MAATGKHRKIPTVFLPNRVLSDNRCHRRFAPTCPRCSEDESLEHIILVCPALITSREILLQKITATSDTILQPLNLDSLMSSGEVAIYKAIFDFLRQNNINI
uniref:Alpha-1,3-mannosyltransferase MNN1 n=2 Tax=Lygus hesperus TaxID=30085 RepID=A0A0A9ZB85_LYGHE